MKGRFRVVGKPPRRIDGAYEGADGAIILLSGGARLEVVPPPRPHSVPPAAHWAGGPQCGAFMECAAQGPKEFLCTVYEEETGKVVANGRYEAASEIVPVTNDDLNGACAAKDWNIELRGDGLLRPVPAP
jgi:hypothetical protein